MTIARFSLLIAAAALCACGSHLYWRADGKTEPQIRQDKMQCEEEVANYSRYMGKPGDSKIVEPRMSDCMGLKGYDRVSRRELPEGAPRVE